MHDDTEEEHNTVPPSNTDEQDTERSEPNREEVYRTFKKIQELARKYGW